MRTYEVLVGNIGVVYAGGDEFRACQEWDAWVAASISGSSGKASGEDVVLMMGERILREYVGYNNQNE